jgi:hypothetical protein
MTRSVDGWRSRKLLSSTAVLSASGRADAVTFKGAVDAAGQPWPSGWRRRARTRSHASLYALSNQPGDVRMQQVVDPRPDLQAVLLGIVDGRLPAAVVEVAPPRRLSARVRPDATTAQQPRRTRMRVALVPGQPGG